jgi:hypothetical protein
MITDGSGMQYRQVSIRWFRHRPGFRREFDCLAVAIDSAARVSTLPTTLTGVPACSFTDVGVNIILSTFCLV